MNLSLYWIPEPHMRLAIAARPRGGDWLDVDIARLRREGVCTLASLLTAAEIEELALQDEAAACQRHGISYSALPVSDRGIPPDVGSWLQFVRELAATLLDGRTVAIHCRMGIGRSALLAASLLMRWGVEVDAALERIAQARGCPVPDTAEQREWLRALKVGWS